MKVWRLPGEILENLKEAMRPFVVAVLQAIVGGCIVALFVFVLPRLRTKASADTGSAMQDLRNDISNLQKSTWTLVERTALAERLATIETRLLMIQTSHETFLREMKEAFIEVAHSPHTPELDALLFKDRDSPEDLNPDEIERVINMLNAQAKQELYPGRQVALLGLRAIYKSQLRMEEQVKRISLRMKDQERTPWQRFCASLKNLLRSHEPTNKNNH